ncbi:iron chaperone [Gimibacter soli]|uniref:DUF1801 domain-containing protein n=1 Tax=Gimibacter soli TaxID=3024400 RepID=A0AAE9XRQ0_9PROT|nr:DUF1801 domain-containing protein [Gimibacter soli]WCL54829.1 DUF1801 domain-containing protein [Gimibacter soli]
MVTRDHSSPEAYCAAVPENQRPLFQAVRSLVLKTAPSAAEGISYGMLHIAGTLNLAAQVQHVSIYVNPEVLDGFRDRFPKAGKSCIRLRSMKDFNEADLAAVIAAAAAHGKGC